MAKQKVIDIGWKVLYLGHVAHYWRTRETRNLSVSLCFQVAPTNKLREPTGPDYCGKCTVIEEGGRLVIRNNGEQNHA